MAERGNPRHGQHLDEKMQQETQGMAKGNQSSLVEEGRETEPFPDDTDPAGVHDALNPGTGPDVAKGRGQGR